MITSNRPAEVLDNWLTQYGYDKNRTTGENAVHLCYLNISEWNGTEWKNRWRLAGADGDPEDTLRQAFLDTCSLWREEANRKAGSRTINLNAILLMSHGEGAFALGDPETERILTWEELTEEQKAEALEDDPNFEKHYKEGVIPVRVVNVITDEGLAGEISMFFDGEPPRVARDEQWRFECEEIEPRGIGDQMLMNIFFFLLMLRKVVVETDELSMEGIMKVAMENTDTEVGRKIAKFLLKLAVDEMPDEVLQMWWEMKEREGE